MPVTLCLNNAELDDDEEADAVFNSNRKIEETGPQMRPQENKIYPKFDRYVADDSVPICIKVKMKLVPMNQE